MTAEAPQTQNAADELVGKVLNAAVGAVEIYNVYIGHKHGLYRALDERGPMTSAELASATSCDERYVREWLQSQAVSGFVSTDDEDMHKAKFALVPGGREVFLDELSEAYVAPLGMAVAATGGKLPALLDAFRTGAGVRYADYGPDAITAQDTLNRPAFVGELVQNWLPAIPSIAERLADTDRPAAVADLGCGAGWSSIALAKAYPHLRITGYDSDGASIELAHQHAAQEGVSDWVTFELRDVAKPFAGSFDVVMMFECLHDMAYPDRVLRNTKAALAEKGEVVVMDEATDEHLVAPTEDPIQRFFANVSPLWCLPQGRENPDADPVGTVMRPDRLRELASAAGFDAEVLPIEHPFWRFYQLY